VPEVKIAAETRDEFGKGAARRSRREGRVPAVLYGHGTDTRHLSLPGHDLMLALKTPNVLLQLDGLKGGSALALPKAVQRDPVRGFIEHVDLILVRRGEKVTVEVPIRVSGDIAPADTMIVEGMELGQAVHAGDLKLPAGVTLQVEPDTLVLHVIAQQGGEEEPEAEEGAGDVPESVDGAAGDSSAESGSEEE
jgi:large subunit ribosomal protein L25